MLQLTSPEIPFENVFWFITTNATKQNCNPDKALLEGKNRVHSEVRNSILKNCLLTKVPKSLTYHT